MLKGNDMAWCGVDRCKSPFYLRRGMGNKKRQSAKGYKDSAK